MKNYQADKNLLKNRNILVTGASDGIGKAAAKCFAQHQATVILLGRNQQKLENVYDEIIQENGPKPAIVPFDLNSDDEKAYGNLAAMLAGEFQQLDGLLHNAGLLGQRTPIQYYDIKTWQTVMQVNVTAAFLLSKTLLPLLQKSTDARILFTSSGVGRKGRAYWGAYAVSKFATEGFMQTLADELEDSNICVNSINPGATRTAMRGSAYPAEDPKSNPSPDEIMPCYLYLMGPDSREINGQAFNAQ